MKNTFRHTLTILAAGALLPAGGLLAQSPAPTATPSVSVPADTTTTETSPAAHTHRGDKARGRLAVLTPEERQKLKEAHRKAKNDPAVKSAEATRETDRRGYHRAMRDAMLRADPSVAPILEKMRENRPGKKKNA